MSHVVTNVAREGTPAVSEYVCWPAQSVSEVGRAGARKLSPLQFASMQTIAPGEDDIDALNGYGIWRRLETTKKRRFNVRIALEATGVVGLLALLCWVIALSVRLRDMQHNANISSECMHALGGGPVGPGGSLHPATPEMCVQQLHTYARTVYWREVEIAAQDAMNVFGITQNMLWQDQQTSAFSGRILAAKLQKTLPRSLLSILGASSRHLQPKTSSLYSTADTHTRLGGPGHCGPGDSAMVATAAAPRSQLAVSRPGAAHAAVDNQQQKKLVVFDIDETILSNMPQILDPETWPWEKWVTAAQAAPLQPMLKLYKGLCSHGYAIALVTGRREPSRNSTMTNLERAGYGQPCASNSYRVGSDSSDKGISRIGDPQACCYDALMMRPQNDTRLASVYKPWARRQLLASGKYQLVALLGDQYSDLNGEGVKQGVLAYKLPNPFYFIL